MSLKRTHFINIIVLSTNSANLNHLSIKIDYNKSELFFQTEKLIFVTEDKDVYTGDMHSFTLDVFS